MIFLDGISPMIVNGSGMMAVVFIANANIAEKKSCRILKEIGSLLIKEVSL